MISDGLLVDLLCLMKSWYNNSGVWWKVGVSVVVPGRRLVYLYSVWWKIDKSVWYLEVCWCISGGVW